MGWQSAGSGLELGEDVPMTVRWLTAFLDTPRGSQSDAVVEFWQAVTASRLSTRRGSSGEFATLVPPDGDAYLRLQDLDDGPAGCHLDLHVDDVRDDLRRCRAAGAMLVGDFGSLVVLKSPGGLGFCLVAHRGERVRPRPNMWPGGHHSVVDQLCLDVARQEFEAEAAFWAVLTDWPRRHGSLPEFDHLARPNNNPLRLLLQRLGDDGLSRSVGAHLDLACDDVDAEVTRHQALGADYAHMGKGWVTLRDPAGREYCVTGRDPFTGA